MRFAQNPPLKRRRCLYLLPAPLAVLLLVWALLSSQAVHTQHSGRLAAYLHGLTSPLNSARGDGLSRNFHSPAAQATLPALQQRPAQAELERWWGLEQPPRGPQWGAPPTAALRIPRILHHIYFPDLAAYQQLTRQPGSSTRMRWGQSCVLHHPGWDYVFWDLAAANTLIERHYPGFADMWRAMDDTINRANAARYFILHAFGGLYLDLDAECWRGTEPWLQGADVVLQGTPGGVTNGVMAGVAGHPLWEAAIQRVHAGWRRADQARLAINSTMQAGLTGPSMLRRVVVDDLQLAPTAGNRSLAGRHSRADGTTLVVHPVGAWFMPCLHSDNPCHQRVAQERALGLAPLAVLAGYHRYSATWLEGGNPAGIHSKEGLLATLCRSQVAPAQQQQRAEKQQQKQAAAGGNGQVQLPALQATAKPLLPLRLRLDIGSMLEREGLHTGAELGVQTGAFSAKTLAAWPSCTRYYLVDLWGHQENYKDVANVAQAEQERRFAAAKLHLAAYSGKTTFLRNYTTLAAALVPDASLDYVYLDARHDYCGVREDLEAWWPKLRSGGILAGHDYLNAAEVRAKPSPTKQDWALCMDGSRHEGAVKGAVNEFALRHGLTVTVTYGEPAWPSWLARKP